MKKKKNLLSGTECHPQQFSEALCLQLSNTNLSKQLSPSSSSSTAAVPTSATGCAGQTGTYTSSALHTDFQAVTNTCLSKFKARAAWVDLYKLPLYLYTTAERSLKGLLHAFTFSNFLQSFHYEYPQHQTLCKSNTCLILNYNRTIHFALWSHSHRIRPVWWNITTLLTQETKLCFYPS